MPYIQTKVDLDLSKIRHFSKEDARQKVKAALLREAIKLSTESGQMKFYALSSTDAQDKDILPKFIRLYVFSSEPIDGTLENESIQAYAHTLVPVNYSVEVCEGSMLHVLRRFKSKSEYIFNILEDFDFLKSARAFSRASEVVSHTTKALSVDDKIQNFLRCQSLRDRIQQKYHFFDEAIQAYDSNSMQTLLPESWPVKSIMRIIRSDYCDELSLFSLICLKIQHERSHGKTIPNMLIEVPQEEPVHIGLFDTYQVYLDAMKKIIDGINCEREGAEKDKQKCLALFNQLESKLNRFIWDHFEQGAEVNPLRQNAWINLLQRVKSLFHWVALLYISDKEKKESLYGIPWIPFSAKKSAEDVSYKMNPLYRVRAEYRSGKSEADIRSIIAQHREGFELENYMKLLEKEVSQGIYTFASDYGDFNTTHQALQDVLKPKAGQTTGRFVSGLGCHLEIAEPLTERDLILMSYTSLTPVGHFMPAYSFHDGAWRSSCWLRAHDPFHEGVYVRTFERMGVDVADLSIHRYRHIDKMSHYLEIIHKMIALSNNPDKGLSEIERDYIALNLFTAHEVSFNNQPLSGDILDSPDYTPLLSRQSSLIAMLQDLLFSMDIRVEEFDNGNRSVILPGRYELEELALKTHGKYRKIKRDALVEHVNEKLLMPPRAE